MSDARLTGVVVSWSFSKGNVTRQSGRRMPEDLKQAKIWGKTLRGGKPFWKKVLPPRAPPFQKLLPVGLLPLSLRKDGKARREEGVTSIPHSHVMARQEAEFMAREGRDMRQGEPGPDRQIA